MEIKLLTINEMPQALQIARGVFDYCLRKSIPDPENIAGFEAYANEENVRSLMEQGRLLLWAAYEMGHMVAMSGMQSEGHITMLYVLPVYQRRGCGRQLLLAMRKHARSQYGLPVVTVTAMPAWTASYFQRQRFTALDPMQVTMAPYVYMQAKSIYEISYEKKQVPAGAFIGTAVGGLAASMFVAFLFMATYF